MKKLLAMALAAAMTLSLCVFPARAEAASGEGQGPAPEAAGIEEYAAGNDTAKATVDTGSLTVSNKVVGTPPATLAGGHTISVMFTGWTPPTTLKKVVPGVVDVLGTWVHLKLQSGQSVTIDGIPAGTKYQVFETFENYVPSSVTRTCTGGAQISRNDRYGASGTIGSGAADSVTFTNFYLGRLTIHKTVEGRNYKGGTLTFTVKAPEGVTLDQAAAYYGAKSISADHTTLTVDVKVDGTSNEGSAALYNLPAGSYTVTEVLGEGSSLAPKSGSKEATGTVIFSRITTVEVGNTYTQPAGSLTVTNTVVGGTDPSVGFQFTVTFDNVPDEGFVLTGAPAQEIRAGGESVNLTINGGGSVTLGGIPVGVAYTVTETNVQGFVSASTTASGTIETKGQEKTASFTNYKTGSLTVTKTVKAHDPSGTAPAGAAFQIDVQFALPTGVSSCEVRYDGTARTITSGDNTITVDLAGGESCTFSGLPIGTAYTVEETLTSDQQEYYTTAISGRSGTIGETASEATVTNAYYEIANDTGVLWLRTVVQGSGSGVDPTFTFTVTFEQGTAKEDAFKSFIDSLGGAVQTVELKDGENKVFLGIPVGTKYTIEEQDPGAAGGYTPSHVVIAGSDGEEIGSGPLAGANVITGAIENSRDVNGYTFYNQYLKDLTLELVLDGNVPDGVEFTFELRFSGLKADQVSSLMEIIDANGPRGSEVLLPDFQADDAVTITLRKGAAATRSAGVDGGDTLVATIRNVPLGVSHYTITQVGANRGDSVTYAVGSGKVDVPTAEGASTGDRTFADGTSYVTMKNSYSGTGWLTIEKQVEGGANSSADDVEYTFEITRKEDNILARTVTITGQGSETVSLPAGDYVVTETTAGGNLTTVYRVDGGAAGLDPAQVTITAGADGPRTVTVTNIYTGSLTIYKTVEGRNYKGGTLTFTVKAPEGVTLDQPAAYYGAKSVSADHTTLTVEVEVDGTGNEGSAALNHLPVGDYTVTEVLGAGSSLAVKEGTDNPATAAVVFNGNAGVSFTNTYTQPAGSLTVTNTVVGGTDSGVDFRFTVTFDNVPGEGFVLTAGDGATQEITESSKSVSLTIPGGGSVTLGGIPVGAAYTVTETDVPADYVSASTTASGTIESRGQGKTASFTNYRTGSLTVTKTVMMDDPSVAAPDGAAFQIDVQFALPTGVSSCVVRYNGTARTITSGDNTITVDLSGGESCTFSGLPIGTAYTVEETLTPDQQKNYTTAISGRSGTIGENPSEAAVTNTYYVIDENTGALWLRTVVQGSGSGVHPTFKFTVTFEQGSAEEVAYREFIGSLGGGAVQTVELADGENRAFLGIPVGTEYTVVENEATTFAPANVLMTVTQADGREGSFKIDHEACKVTGKIDENRDVDGVTVYNQYLKDLTLELVLDDNVPDGVEFTFELHFSGLKADQVSSLMKIEDANGTRGSDELLPDFQEDDAVTITLRKGAAATRGAGDNDGNTLVAKIFNVPLGVSHYTITQVGANKGNSVTYEVSSGKVDVPAETGVSTGDQTFADGTSYVTMKNSYSGAGWLTIEKQVEGGANSSADDVEYTFEITRKEDNILARTVTITGQGSETVSLPAGDYVVTETTTGDDFDTEYQVDDGAAGEEPAQVTITAGADGPSTVTVTNTYQTPPVDSLPSVTVKTEDAANGSFTVSDQYAGAGQEVIVTPRADEGYVVETVTVTDKNGEAVEVTANADGTYSFIMPVKAAQPVTVKGTFRRPTGSSWTPSPSPSVTVRTENAANGSFTVSDKYAGAGQTVIVTPKADEGYVVDQVTVTDTNGEAVEVTANADGTYSFVMPARTAQPVTVKVTFKEKEQVHVCPSENYTDVDQSAWYHEGVDFAIENEMMIGKAEGIFAPDDITTRAEMVTILYRLEGEPAVTKDIPFEDVPVGQWFSDAINWAAANEIVGGYGNGKFGPEDTITREQMAVILYRYATYKGYNVTNLANLTGYTDAGSVNDWAVKAIQWAVAEGIIEGTSTTTLAPSGDSTRAQVATILMRFWEDVVK